MTADVDICNRALSEIGARTNITSLTDASPAAVACSFHYGTLRRQLLRTAPWGFSRKTVALTLKGSLVNNTAPYPWQFAYVYPADCLKFRYVIPPPPSVVVGGVTVGTPVYYAPWTGPSRSWRYVIATDDSKGSDQRIILSNVENALGVYNKDVTSPDIWDDLFQNAMVAALAFKIVIPLTGNAGMKQGLVQIAEDAITKARIADGNEAIASTSHSPDWIETRGAGSPFGWAPAFNDGNWVAQWENMSWGA